MLALVFLYAPMRRESAFPCAFLYACCLQDEKSAQLCASLVGSVVAIADEKYREIGKTLSAERKGGYTNRQAEREGV